MRGLTNGVTLMGEIDGFVHPRCRLWTAAVIRIFQGDAGYFWRKI